MHQPDISIVVPTYNAETKMNESIDSLREFCELADAEVIFVDDASSDGTVQMLERESEGNPGWRIHVLDDNSGSAAKPRNYGVDVAAGRFVYFHDADDVLIPQGLAAALQFAKDNRSDCVRGSLIVRQGNGSETLSELVPRWDSIGNPTERLRAIVRHQSLTCSFIVRREIILENDIRFDPLRRIGEDIMFTAEVLTKCERIAYRSKPIRKYVRAAVGQESVTQKITSGQFAQFVESWKDVETILSRVGISFVKEHGFAAIQYALRQFVWFKTEDLTEAAFDLFSDFINEHWHIIRTFPFSRRFKEPVLAARNANHTEFNETIRLRLLLAGHDLKFLSAFMPKFDAHFNVRIDQWSGHDSHSTSDSEDLLKWADIVWVEWLLGAAVWYSNRVDNHQRLVIRTHRSEVSVDYGDKLNLSRVSALIAISPHTLGDFSDRFDIPRDKFWMIPNAHDVASYSTGTGTARLKELAMIGILPKLKGYDRAIRVLAELRTRHPEIKLNIFGKQPSELEWLNRIPEEKRYYEMCRGLAEDLGVSDAIEFKGWVDPKKELSTIGFVLSFSEFEGMQVAMGDAYAAGALGLMINWRGSRQCYPNEYVFETEAEMTSAILAYIDEEETYIKSVERARQFISQTLDINPVWAQVNQLIRSVRA